MWGEATYIYFNLVKKLPNNLQSGLLGPIYSEKKLVKQYLEDLHTFRYGGEHSFSLVDDCSQLNKLYFVLKILNKYTK